MIAQTTKKSIFLEHEDKYDEAAVNASITKIAELEYLADLVPQLHKMSAGLGEATLSYLFEMLIIEIRLQLDIEKYKADTLNL